MATIIDTINDLGKIITDAVTAGNATNVPARSIRKTLIKVTTGQYREVLPIIVPAECCIMGDELRSVNVQPRKASNSTLTPRNDYRYTSTAIQRVENIIGDIVTGVAVTPTSGNTQTQDRTYPYAETTAVSTAVEQQFRNVRQKIDTNLGLKLYANLEPWYDMSSPDTGKGRDLMITNKEFLKAETTAWIAENYPNLYYSKTKCKQDIGFLVDAVAYDMTYGGNWQSVIAGEAYFDGNKNINAQTEIVTNGTFTTASNWNITNTAWIITGGVLQAQSGTAGIASQTINTEPGQEYTIDFTASNYSSNITVYATNVGSTTKLKIATTVAGNGAGTYTFTAEKIQTRIYFEKDTGAGADIDNVSIDSPQRAATIAAYGHLKALMQTVQRNISVTPLSQTDVAQISGEGGTAGVSTIIGNKMDDIIQIITDGSGSVATSYPSLAGADINVFNDSTDIVNAKAQVGEYTIDFINRNFGSFQYDSGTCRRDLRRIFEAVQNDVLTGSNYLSIQAGRRYGNSYVSYVIEAQKTQTVGAIRKARDLTLDEIVDATYKTRTRAAFNEVIDLINNGPTAADAITYPSYNSTANAINAKDNLQANIDFMVADVTAYINQNYPLLTYDVAKCERDVRYIIDGVCFDVMYGGNIAAVRLAESYFDDDKNILVSSQETETIAAYTHLSSIAQDIAQEISVTPQTGNTELQTTLGSPASGTEATLINNVITEITSAITAGGPDGISAVTEVTSTETGQTATDYAAFDSEQATIIPAVIQYITDTYSDFKYDHAKCTRDLGLIFDAARYDAMLGTNYASWVTALSYLRRTTSKVLGEQKDATIAANTFAFKQMRGIIGSIETATNNALTETLQLVNDALWSASYEGANKQVADPEVYNAIYQMEINKQFIIDEALAYVDDYCQNTVTQIRAADNSFLVPDANVYFVTQPVKFTSLADSTTLDEIDDVTEDQTYYIRQILSPTKFTVSETIGGPEVNITVDSDLNFIVDKAYQYNRTLCARDVAEYIKAAKWDLQYAGNWKKVYRSPRVAYDTSDTLIDMPGWYRLGLAQRYYTNSVIGSQEEDFYYLRNGTGLRLQTMDGLQGDLGPMNQYGTRRPTAGAYASLDPGWGPDDQRAWITARSPYVQNCTTFGYAAVGQKIDGALHNGGNDSIVSNDFTQVISDGIGAWLTNNGRAELVSVFTYYSHIGYLCETGGRARATNGNNSYGTYGSVAEGVDPDETPVTAIVDNVTQYNATVSNVFTDTDQILALEYGHAGQDYTEVQFDIFGAGDDEVLVGEDFRDRAISRVEVGEVEDGDAGGTNYTVVSNTAQAGSATSINLAATDGSLSNAYNGMAIYITGGAGVGNYGYITSYNSGSKLANVSDRYGDPGWSHVVAGTTIVSPNSSSTYVVEPRITFSDPAAGVLTAESIPADTHNNIAWAETAIEYTGVASESNGDGSGATFDVTRIGRKYYVSLNASGTDFVRNDTVTISGADLGGATPLNDITVTITTVNANGNIVDFDFAGFGRPGYFFVLSNGNIYTAVEQDSWTTNAVTGNHQNLAWGFQDDGSTLFKPSAIIVTAASSNTIKYLNGVETLGTWASASTGITAGARMGIAFGRPSAGVNKFIATSNATRDIAYSSDGGANWTSVANALPATGFMDIDYGMGLYVAVAPGTSGVAYSADGENWTGSTMPAAVDYDKVKFGGGIWVAMAAQAGPSNLAHSIDGINWTAASSPDAGKTPASIAYGHGVWILTYTAGDEYAYSYDGVEWFTGVETGTFGGPVTFGSVYENASSTFRGMFPSLSDSTNQIRTIYRGAVARGRASVANQKIFEVRMVEPGSYYTALPTITVTDPNNIEDVVLTPRITDGTLAQPSFANRGNGFITASAEINVNNSNGQADFRQDGQFVAVRRLSSRPVSGSNVVFDSLPNQTFKLVNTVSFVGSNDGSYTAFLQLSPDMTINDAPEDGDPVTMRIRFSQVRLTGHDFLDIGTGNFTDTNYPGVPVNAPDQANETKDDNGGRVFFTATDQDGNFRVGDLFSIEQATGVATLNAEAFNIAGLQELTLGEVTLGGNSASITEFSTDPFFTANSDTVVPTQRAVKAYIEAQIGGGGATLNVNSVTAGDIFINTNQITTVSGELINIRANVNFEKFALGLPLAYNYFLR